MVVLVPEVSSSLFTKGSCCGGVSCPLVIPYLQREAAMVGLVPGVSTNLFTKGISYGGVSCPLFTKEAAMVGLAVP